MKMQRNKSNKRLCGCKLAFLNCEMLVSKTLSNIVISLCLLTSSYKTTNYVSFAIYINRLQKHVENCINSGRNLEHRFTHVIEEILNFG